jgi:hypothetical protein
MLTVYGAPLPPSKGWPPAPNATFTIINGYIARNGNFASFNLNFGLGHYVVINTGPPSYIIKAVYGMGPSASNSLGSLSATEDRPLTAPDVSELIAARLLAGSAASPATPAVPSNRVRAAPDVLLASSPADAPSLSASASSELFARPDSAFILAKAAMSSEDQALFSYLAYRKTDNQEELDNVFTLPL